MYKTNNNKRIIINRIISSICALVICISAVPNHKVHASGMYNPINIHSKYDDCDMPETYGEWEPEWWDTVKPYLPLDTKPKNIDGYKFNYKLWHDKGIVVYGSPSTVWENEWKNATQSGSVGNEVVIQNAGYYNNNNYGEWKYHGFTNNGEKYTNINFPNDTGTVSMTKKNWISKPWEDPWHLEGYISIFNRRVIENGNPITQNWMRAVTNGWGEETAYSNNPELYFNVLSAPTPWEGGQLRGWHNTTGLARYQTFDIAPHYKKTPPAVSATVDLLTSPSELVLRDDANNSGDKQTFRVRIRVDAELNDYDYVNDEVDRVNYFTRYDIDYGKGNNGWDFYLEDLGWVKERAETNSLSNGQTAYFYKDMKGSEVKALTRAGDGWDINIAGRARVYFHAPSNVKPTPELEQEGSFFGYAHFDGIKTITKGGIYAALKATTIPETIDKGKTTTVEVNLNASEAFCILDGKSSTIDNYRFWVSTNEADIFSTAGLPSLSPYQLIPLSNIGPNTTIYCGVRVFDKELQTAGLEPIATAKTLVNVREIGVSPDDPTTPELPRFPPPPLVVNMDINIPEIAFDIVPFVASDNTKSDIESKSMYIDGVPASVSSFFNGSYLWGEDKVGFHRVDCEYTSIDGVVSYSTDWVYVYSTKPNAAYKLSGPMKINRLTTVADTSSSHNVSIVVNSYPIVKRTWTIEKRGTDLFIDPTTETDAVKDFLCKKPGQYTISLVVQNSLGRISDPYSVTFTIMDDYGPATICNLEASVLARNETVKAYAFESVSTDNDIVQSIVIDLWYDSNNDGTYDQRIGAWDGKNGFPEYTPTKLGKYKYIVTSTEEFGQPTINAFVTPLDRKKSSREKEFEVDNYAPMTDIYSTIPVTRPNVDLYIMLDKNLEASKTQWVLDNVMNLSNNLIRMNIVPRIKTWDMKTYTYSQSASTSANTGTSYPYSATAYSNNGYSGSLPLNSVSDNGSNVDYGRYESKTESQTFSASWDNTVTDVYDVETGTLTSTSESSPAPNSYSINENGYSGSIPRTGTSSSGRTDTTSGGTRTVSETYTAYYSGSLSKTVSVWVPNMVWVSDYTGYYSGTIYKNVRQTYIDPWRTNSKKYVLYVTDSNIAELSDLQTVMSKTDASLIVAGNAEAQTQITSSSFILNNKSIEVSLNDALTIIEQNSPSGEKLIVQAGIDTFTLHTANYDTENDPLTIEEQLYVQNPYYFDNPTGTDVNTVSNFSNTSGWTTELKSKLNTVGEYKIYRRVKDRPSTDLGFSQYSYYSGTPYITVYAHRKPIAQATVSYKFNTGTGRYELRWMDTSFDYDHSISRVDKGIVERKVMYRKNGGEWYYAWPSSLAAGYYEFTLYVKDPEGTWSEPCNLTLNLMQTDNTAPWININPWNRDWLNIDAAATISAGDSGSGVDEVRYKWSTTTDSNVGTYTSINYTSATSINIPTAQSQEGVWYIHATASDRMSNNAYTMGGPYRIDKTAPVIAANITSHEFILEPAVVNLSIIDALSGVNHTNYCWSTSPDKPVMGWQTTTQTNFSTTKTQEGEWYLHIEAWDNAGNSSYSLLGKYTVIMLRLYDFTVTMIKDVTWRDYYFDGVDSDGDGQKDIFSRKTNTDIKTTQMPVNNINGQKLAAYDRDGIDAGCMVNFYVKSQGLPEDVVFTASYITDKGVATARISPVSRSNETWSYEWIVPLECKEGSFVSFNVEAIRSGTIYGNEYWIDSWVTGNYDHKVFYIIGNVLKRLKFNQSW